jgi:Co/Zn/Cd efflux system component
MTTKLSRSVFKVLGMDCAAEENLIRMRLEMLGTVKSLEFDLPARLVTIYHNAQLDDIAAALATLDLNASHEETTITEAAIPREFSQYRILWAVLLINLGFFAIEFTTGIFSNSMGLIADSLDMLADALVYGMSLLAVGASVARKKAVAKWSGYFQMTLALLGFSEVLRRFIGLEEIPDYRVMIVVSGLALIANAICLFLLQRSRDREVHIQASMIFTSNDIIINAGVIVAALFVGWSNSGLPDLIVGAVVFLLVTRGAFPILALAKYTN